MIQRDEDGAFIPTDPDNVDYQAYLACSTRVQRADALFAAGKGRRGSQWLSQQL